MYKKLMILALFCFIVIGSASAADFKINDGFNSSLSDYSFYNEDQNMYINIWDYDDEILSEAYLENSSSYRIVSGENNTYNFVFDSYNDMDHVISYITKGYVALDCGVLEIAEVDGKKQIILVSKEGTNVDSLKTCYDELMKFNQNNNIEPIADAI
ncbi:hypothetical protein mru_1970 [Methanobrevibacter ruminantium M1]|uniref:Uncharacterized protein n=1 Tax=Methanobrevibacter ruminantium (strain ATCC 35063 / DSM 1093 / JCM 13430 / OCM 146 / M1) TaxID=634498 RepID=D3E096_METRM|nr:hypothetical protein [Methanobrevibacter ruminantium]ADC47820.1 hypothetical protein mru_1970 [Methanobrevibacter ruminantium M1]